MTLRHTVSVLAVLLLPACGTAGVKDLGENLESKFQAKMTLYPRKPAGSFVPSAAIEDSFLTPEFLYSWQTWLETENQLRINAGGWLEYGVPSSYRWTSGFELFQDDEMKSRSVVLNEIYAVQPFGNLDLLAGRSIQRNTLALLYPLTDRYAARDFNDPVNPKIFGQWQVRADYYLNDWQFGAAVLPVYQPQKVPGYESRWWIRDIEPLLGEPLPPDAGGQVHRSAPVTSWENTGILLTLRTRRPQWDAFTTLYHGYTRYTAARLEKPAADNYQVTLEYLPGLEWSGGLSTVFGSVELHSEALYHRSYSGRDDEYINGLIGFTWRPNRLAEWLRCSQACLIVEYAREHVLEEQDPELGYVSSSKPFRFGKNTLFSEFTVEMTARDTAALTYFYNFDSRGSFTRLWGGRRFRNAVHLKLVLELFAGDGLYFGTWERNDRIYLNYEYHF